MSIKLNKVDLYFNGNQTQVDDDVTILVREPREYVESSNDRVHTVRQGETWQSIAFDKYGNSKYWHYITDINEIFNPFDDLPVGSSIIIPDIDNY